MNTRTRHTHRLDRAAAACLDRAAPPRRAARPPPARPPRGRAAPPAMDPRGINDLLVLAVVAPHGVTDLVLACGAGAARGDAASLLRAYGVATALTAAAYSVHAGHLALTFLLATRHFAADLPRAALSSTAAWALCTAVMLALLCVALTGSAAYHATELLVLSYMAMAHVPLHYARVAAECGSRAQWWLALLLAALTTAAALTAGGQTWAHVRAEKGMGPVSAALCAVVNGHVLFTSHRERRGRLVRGRARARARAQVQVWEQPR
jgi:hypothetical protein